MSAVVLGPSRWGSVWGTQLCCFTNHTLLCQGNSAHPLFLLGGNATQHMHMQAKFSRGKWSWGSADTLRHCCRHDCCNCCLCAGVCRRWVETGCAGSSLATSAPPAAAGHTPSGTLQLWSRSHTEAAWGCGQQCCATAAAVKLMQHAAVCSNAVLKLLQLH
jgi:hypothetical protein